MLCSSKISVNRNLLISWSPCMSSLSLLCYANWSRSRVYGLAQNPAQHPILSIPLVLRSARFTCWSCLARHHATGRSTLALGNIIHWGRAWAAIGIIFFVSLFSLDVFSMDAPPLECWAIPHAQPPRHCMLILLIFAWKRPVIGFVAFLVAQPVYILRFVRVSLRCPI